MTTETDKELTIFKPAKFNYRQTAAVQHGAEGVHNRIQKGLPLATDDLARQRELIGVLGYDPDGLPSGALGLFISIVADNVLLSQRFLEARLWAAEQNDLEKWESLAKRSGWRNDKTLKSLQSLMELTSQDKVIDYEAIIQEEKK